MVGLGGSKIFREPLPTDLNHVAVLSYANSKNVALVIYCGKL